MKWVFFLVLPLWDYFKTRSSQKLSRASLHRLSLWPHRPHIQLFSYNLSSVLILENALHATAPGLLHLQFPSVWNILSLGSHRFATSPSSGHYLSAIFQDHPILNHKPSLRGMPILPSCSVFFISLIFLCLFVNCLSPNRMYASSEQVLLSVSFSAISPELCLSHHRHSLHVCWVSDSEFPLFLSKKRQQSTHLKFLFGIYSM